MELIGVMDGTGQVLSAATMSTGIMIASSAWKVKKLITSYRMVRPHI